MSGICKGACFFCWFGHAHNELRVFVFLTSGIKKQPDIKDGVKYWAATYRFIGVFAVTLIVWKHFYLMFKFQSRFLWGSREGEHRAGKWIILWQLCWHLHKNGVLCYHTTSGAVHCLLLLKSYFIIVYMLYMHIKQWQDRGFTFGIFSYIRTTFLTTILFGG